jgi:flagellar biosynthesis/type III secretory pathway protein FliH
MYDKKKREEEKAREQAYKKAVVILEEAKNKSLNIIKESSERAKRMIKETDLEIDESKEFVQEQLKSAATEFKGDVLKEADEFRAELHKDALQTEKELRDKIAAEYTAMETELKAYKEQRLKEIDQKSLAIIEDIVREYFAKTMKVEDHLDFIRQMLEKHKKPFEIEG